MSTTLQKTINWAKPFLRYRPLVDTNNEPALSAANLIKQIILGAPFAWPWNRDNATFTCTNGQQDYTISESDVLWVENASVEDFAGGSQTPNKWMAMQVSYSLGKDSAPGRPRFLSRQFDDGAGNITYRLMPVPDKAYPVSISVQMQAAQFTVLTDKWDPIPDYMQYIPQWGFLALMYLYADDPRFQVANQKFVAHLLGAAEGLSQTQINIFLNNWQAITGTPMANQQKLAQGIQAQGV